MSTNPDNQKAQLTEIAKAVGAILGLPLVLFTVVNSIVAQPLVSLVAAFITAIVVSVWVVRSRWLSITQIISGWLALMVVVLAGFVIWPRTMTVEGIIRDTAGNPVSNEVVKLFDYSGKIYETKTNIEGYYQFVDVPSGKYRVQARTSEVEGATQGILVRVVQTNFAVSEVLITPSPTNVAIITSTLTVTPVPLDTTSGSPTNTSVLSPTSPIETKLDVRKEMTEGCRVIFNGFYEDPTSNGLLLWDWGDQNLTKGDFPQEHTYTKSGTYMISVTTPSGMSKSFIIDVNCLSTEPTETSDLKGKVVTVYGSFYVDEASRFKEAMAPFEKRTGIVIEYSSISEGDPDIFASEISTKAKTDSLPDVIAFYWPGFLPDLVRQGHIVDLNEFLDREYLKQQYQQSWLDMATIDGKMAGVWYRTNIKSLVWYPVPEFEQAGYQVPTTWDQMITLSNQMAADGHTPWCIGNESGGASGWPATDWIEEIMLRTTSLENYDRWTRGELKFNSPEVRHAINIADEIWHNPKFVYGGIKSINTTFFGDSITPMFNNPPDCWLHHQGNFISLFFPGGTEIGKDVDFFYLPPIDSEYGKPVLVGGDIFAMTNDRPEVREFIRYLTTGESARIFVEDGGTIAPQKDAKLEWYPTNAEKRYAEILNNADIIRFDGSDFMPFEVGFSSFWQGMIDYIDGKKDLDTVLKEIDDSWSRQ